MLQTIISGAGHLAAAARHCGLQTAGLCLTYGETFLALGLQLCTFAVPHIYAVLRITRWFSICLGPVPAYAYMHGGMKVRGLGLPLHLQHLYRLAFSSQRNRYIIECVSFQ